MSGCGQLHPFGMSGAHTHGQLYTLPHFSFFPFVGIETHGAAYLSAHNGELLGAILGMSGHCCMFSYWLISEIPLMNRK